MHIELGVKAYHHYIKQNIQIKINKLTNLLKIVKTLRG